MNEPILRPMLAGQAILLPDGNRIAALQDVLHAHGAAVYRYEASGGYSESRTVDRWLSELIEGEYDTVVFETAQGVHLLAEFADALGRLKDAITALKAVQVVAMGGRPARALQEIGVTELVKCSGRSLESLLTTLAGLNIDGHILAVQQRGTEIDLRLGEYVALRNARLRLVANHVVVDPQAEWVLNSIKMRRANVLVFTSVSQISWLFDAAKTSGREAELDASLNSILVVGTESVTMLLQQRGIAHREISSRTLVLVPRIEDVVPVFSPSSDTLPAIPAQYGKLKVNNLSDSKQTIVVVGNGMVGYKFCEKITDLDKDGRFQVVTFCEEPRPAYDRVQLSSFFSGKSAKELELAPVEWYQERGIDLRIGQKATSIDRTRQVVIASNGEEIHYDQLVLATGSAPFVPPVPGMDKEGVFVYRTIEDLEGMTAYGKKAKSAAVIGGGLLGLEAAKAVLDLGLETHVVEFAPRLMPRQLDQAGAGMLVNHICSLGVQVHTNCNTQRVQGDSKVSGLRFNDGSKLDVDMIVVSAGIRPRDELARDAGIQVGERGGILVDATMVTSDPLISAIGECALFNGMIYGLVAPGYDMAEVLAKRLLGDEKACFESEDMSTKLKLMGVDVGSIGDALATGGKTVVFEDLIKKVYKKLILNDEMTEVVGAILVGDTSDFGRLLHLYRSKGAVPAAPEDLILGSRGGDDADFELPDDAQICSCNNVSKGEICAAIADGKVTVGDIKSCTKAGGSCGGCVPMVSDILLAQLKKSGKSVRAVLCEHFDLTRQELFDIVKVKGYHTFDEIIKNHGTGSGCELCKPAAASVLASVHNEVILKAGRDVIQDTNDRFLANMQRTGLYSVVPRVPGGEILPDQLIVLGQVAKKYNLYSKITGGQRVDLFGAHVNDLPDIWEALIAVGFETGHAYGKSLRTVKSCVGSTWCRYGLRDSVGFAIRVENRYKGLRSPHKLKSAVSGCVRECAEAQSKDFGIIATEKGWNLYVCGNGGAKPRHTDLLAADIDEETCIKYIDRFLMFYVKTADKLQRTSVWMEKLEGGIEYLRRVVIDDCLGIAAELEASMQHIVDTYECEWKAVVTNPELRERFNHFANSDEKNDTIEYVSERGQRRPADWVKGGHVQTKRSLPVIQTAWVEVGTVGSFPSEGGRAVKYGKSQLAVFNLSSQDKWYAVQNQCPHQRDMVLARGIVGDEKGVPKVACPLHKKTFSLEDGSCLSGEDYSVMTFPVKVENGIVYVELPPVEMAEAVLGEVHECKHDEGTAAEA